MNDTEKSFLQAMDSLARDKETWLQTGCIVLKSGEPTRMSPTNMIGYIGRSLWSAGQILGLNTRWHVTASNSPKDLAFIPKNGQSGRMLQFYHELYTERELSDGFSE